MKGRTKDRRQVKSSGGASANSDDGAVDGAPIKGKARQKGKLTKKGRSKGHGAHTYSLDDLEQELAAAGLRVKGVSADGNCFFRALSDQLHGNESCHGALRSRVMAHVEECREQYEPFVEDDEPFAKYVARMRKDGTWAGHIELQAASLALKANISVYQAGQPVWTIKNFEGDAPTLHLSYHDGQHYNSVRLAGDFGSGPPQAITLGAAAADPAAVSAGQRSWGAQEVARVSAGTGCDSEARVAQALEECRGDVDQAIELLIERMAQDPDGSEAEGSGAAAENSTPSEATPPQQPSGSRSSSSAGAELSSSQAAGEAQQGQRQGLQQRQNSPPGEGSAAAPPNASSSSGGEGTSRAAAQQAQRDSGGSMPAGQPVAAAGGALWEGYERIELQIQPCPTSPSTVRVLLHPLAGPGTQSAEAASAAGAAGHSSGEEEEEDEACTAAATASGEPQQEQGEAGAQGRGKKTGVRLKGKHGAGRERGKAPSRNKPCPCGSKQKYKNCCGAARGGAGRTGTQSSSGAGEGSGAAAAAAVQLQTLFI